MMITKKLFVYILFYSLTMVSTIISGIAILVFTSLMSIRLTLLSTFQFSKDEMSVSMLFLALPLFIFLFQIVQDVNYRIIHLIGYWAYSIPKFSYRGFSFPKFYERSLQNDLMKASIGKSKYRYRLFSIFQWVISTVAVEFVLAGDLFFSRKFDLKFNRFFIFILIVGALFITFHLWEKLQKKIRLDIAYIENEREFYYKKEK